MSKVLGDLHGVVADGFAKVEVAPPQGMIQIRADLGSPALVAALHRLGLAMPGPRRVEAMGDATVIWMSPDELLLLVPHADAAEQTKVLAHDLAKEHALVVDVSEARAMFRITGPKADQVLMKLTPADVAALPDMEMRRSRIAQVAGAFWRTGPGEINLITFRSVAAYVFALLETSARPGSELFG